MSGIWKNKCGSAVSNKNENPKHIPFFSKICFKCVFMRIPDTILALQYFVTIFAICSIVSLSLFMPSITGL